MKLIVGFSKPKTWKPFAQLIMWAYSVPYDHVYVRWNLPDYSSEILFQASKLTVNFMSFEMFKNDNEVVMEFSLEITPENEIKMVQFAINNASKPYGILEALGMGIVRIFELLGKKIKNPFGDGESTYVCSELAGIILKQFYGANFVEDNDDLTPPAIYKYLTSLNLPSNTTGSINDSSSGQES